MVPAMILQGFAVFMQRDFSSTVDGDRLVLHLLRVTLIATPVLFLRESASSLLHRAAHYIHAQRLASELEGQAASWQLLQHLYCSGYHPAGDNLAGAADAGGRPTYRELAAGLINDDSQLRRYGASFHTHSARSGAALHGHTQMRPSAKACSL